MELTCFVVRCVCVWVLLLTLGMFGLSSAQTNERGTFILFKYQKQMGIENYEIAAEADVLKLNTNFELSFIGGGFSLNTKLDLQRAGLTPLFYETKGKTSTRTSVDTSVTVSNGEATIRNGSDSASRKTPANFFTVLQPAPIAPQMMMFRFWKLNGKKEEIPLLPGGSARIRSHGKDKITIGGKDFELDRYSIEGVMWGRETVWFDGDDNLIALVGADAEMDRFEAVRKGYEAALPSFVAMAAKDAVNHLVTMSAQIRPILSGRIAIIGGQLVGGKDFVTIPDSVILVENGKIIAAGAKDKINIPKGYKTFDAAGKTIIPGLFDMHAHATQSEWFPASLAAGITTMRDAANEFEFIVPIRDAVRSGKITVSPRLLLAGYIDSRDSAVGSMKAETPGEARSIVNRYHKAGFEQVKIYQSLKPELVKIVTAEAHRLGMTVTGHIPTGMTIFEAVDDGFDQVNHLGFVFRVMSPRVLKEGEPRNNDPEAEAAKDGFKFLLDNKIVVEPTLARAEVGSKIFGDNFVGTEPGASKLPFEFEALIRSMGIPQEDAERRRQRNLFSLQVLKALHEAGVPLIVGTDLVLPGHTIFRELELFVQAGLTPIEAIKSATIVPAKAMKLDDELGSIESGNIADLVVIDGDPLKSISNIRTVRFVVKSGKIYDTAPLWRSVNFRP